MIRSFIAIDIPQSIKNIIARVQSDFKESGADVKWVNPELIHLTLKFLGNIKEEQIDEIKKSMIKSVKGITPFFMTLIDIGVFPNIRYPRVIWMGLEDKTERLLILQKNIEENLNILGFTPEERKFSPHLTIGRLKSLKGKSRLANMIHAKKGMNIDGSISVNKINLMKSELRVTGPIYSVLETVSLA